MLFFIKAKVHRMDLSMGHLQLWEQTTWANGGMRNARAKTRG